MISVACVEGLAVYNRMSSTRCNCHALCYGFAAEATVNVPDGVPQRDPLNAGNSEFP